MNESKNKMKISVVSPVYGCVESLSELCKRLTVTFERLNVDYEIILVDDCSPDDAWQNILNATKSNKKIKGVKLSRNFGQHCAITAGLDFAEGDWIVVMDCDLQDKPEEILKLYNTAKKGFDIVVGRRSERKDSFIRIMFSKYFYLIFSYLSEVKIDPRIANFGIYSRKAILSIREMKEQNRSFGLFALWVGFRRIEIDIEHSARPYGDSSYTLSKMITLAMDSIITHSDKLLRLTVKTGFIVTLFSFLFSVWIILRFILLEESVVGWSSLIVVLSFSTGLIIGTTGIVGLYVGKIFKEVKNRPLYIIESTTFNPKKHDE